MTSNKLTTIPAYSRLGESASQTGSRWLTCCNKRHQPKSAGIIRLQILKVAAIGSAADVGKIANALEEAPIKGWLGVNVQGSLRSIGRPNGRDSFRIANNHAERYHGKDDNGNPEDGHRPLCKSAQHDAAFRWQKGRRTDTATSSSQRALRPMI